MKVYLKYDQRRESILKAALKVFSKNGFEASNITEIASLADCSHALLYHHFDSKQHIYDELAHTVFEKQRSMINKVLETKKPPLERIYDLLAIIESALVRDLDNIVLYELAIYLKQITTSDTLVVQPISTSVFLSTIVEGQNDGTIIDGDSESIAELFRCAVQGLIVKKLSGSYIYPIKADTIINLLSKETKK